MASAQQGETTGGAAETATSTDRDVSDQASAGRVLYLAHDLDDPAIWRRVRMLRRAGAEVDLAGFRRGDGPLPGAAIVLGRTRNARMAHRIVSILRARRGLRRALRSVGRPDAIIARNLEMLALAGPLRRGFGAGPPIRLIYEVLDIHRLLVGTGRSSRLLRRIERRLCREIDLLLLSSPAFAREYVEHFGQCRAPIALVENKVPEADLAGMVPPPRRRDEAEEAIRIGWFGILRCAWSLACLDAVTRAAPGRYRVILRGRPALDAVPGFHEIVAANPDLTFEGPYDYPDDLPVIYGDVDLAWLVDRYDAGANSDWLLPNRLYESGAIGVPPIGLAGTEIAATLQALSIGVILDAPTATATSRALAALTPEARADLRGRQDTVPRSRWIADGAECRALLADVLGPREPVPTPEPDGGLLIVIPALNEARHIGGVIDTLAPSMRRLRSAGRAVRLVVSDGGSRDDTIRIASARAAALPDLRIDVIDNPGRLQSAGLNRAVAQADDGMTWFLRMDAHAIYPETYVETLLDEARRTGAASVVVAMRAIGRGRMQRAIALVQNSRLGNGGAAHRMGGAGRVVEHGHHALMRLDAFRAVGGYDESFSHNEDAELDIRLVGSGASLWLTGKTGLDYLPRDRLDALAKQYFAFGRGRARTVRKHRIRPRLRQAVLMALAPLVALSALTPVEPIFAAPVLAWLLACVGGGIVLALSRRSALALTAGPIAALMQLAWSLGFWWQFVRPTPAPAITRRFTPPPEVPAGEVTVGICTFRRSSLLATLDTIERQVVPPGISLRIVVSDNDTQPSAKDALAEFAARSRHEVVYLHAPAGNISVARNAILDEGVRRGSTRLAFIDDDELAPPDWLQSLLERMAEDGADAVVGPVRAIYEAEAPAWMRALGIHDTIPELDPRGRPIAGHSCNVLLNTDAAAFQGLRFDLGRGVSGGEDTAFFEAARRRGARMAVAPDAWLTEPVPPDRARLRWLLKRRYRMGQTHGSLLSEGATVGDAALNLARAAAKVGWCAVATLVTAPVARRRNANLLRGALHVGTMSALLGVAPVRIYGEPVSADRSY
ncbi:glycosyltransferase [uncultured Jannaschia sp.]|uniref:glycosyltransferase n=1 Tax=uncultured Jannaschia sp. TaxID=293347 RepID=UPI0026033761|nr:glycosyltransferase [uncultured Jannaschia sp.]